ncbi:MAG: purine-nucleoside phosphorylase [Caldilineales bacterium]|nr:purine-nucleoside phosphorylase [Caldilineales bacterium]
MKNQFSRQDYERIAAFIAERTRYRPRVAMVLGSGLSPLADAVANADSLPYAEIPDFPLSSVIGHAGCLVIGELAGREVMIMQGRVHYYEGYPLEQITLPLRVMRAFGIDTLILTNAAGGLNPAYQPGDVMLIEDQINLVGMIGHNPLMGPNDAALGPRFPNLSDLYDRGLRQLALSVAAAQGLTLHRGVYVGLAGPAFETPAEVRFLRMIGGDATGMSTTNEAVTARHSGMRVLGFSGISNAAIAAIDTDQEASHEEVLAAGALITPRLIALLQGMLARWDEAASP